MAAVLLPLCVALWFTVKGLKEFMAKVGRIKTCLVIILFLNFGLTLGNLEYEIS